MTIRLAVIFTLIASAAGCLGRDDSGPDNDVSRLATLRAVGSCEEALRYIEDQAIRDMEEALDRNLEAILRGDYCYREGPYGGYADASAGADGGGGYYPPPDDAEDGDGATEHSDTNNQVAGVDEADFIKNDGAYIYILADNRFQIIDAWPALESRVIGSVDVEGEPTRLFVYEDRAVVYSALGPTDPYGYGYGDCTYGYDCDFAGDGRDTKITVFDISDRTSPVLLRETRFSGSYINSRRIDGSVYTVLVFPGVESAYYPTVPDGISYCPDGVGRFRIEAAFADLRRANAELIRGSLVGDWLPRVTDTVYEGGEARTTEDVFGDCEDFYASDLTNGTSLLSVVGLDMGAVAPLTATTVLGRPGAVYVTRDALYVAARHTSGDGGWYFRGEDGGDELTTVHKFLLRPEVPDTVYAATGVVEGHVLNQFAMDEHEGHLRVATSTGWVPDPDVHSNLTVLGQVGETLVKVGKIDDIAPEEDIRAVRFDGDRGFLVTFKKTDPLFAIDLSEPTDPRLAGELLIPGYSTYMQFMDQSHLLTIGYDADDMGSFAWFQGIQLQIFDVSNMERPTLLHRELIGTRGSTSDAATDHLAFNFFPPRDLLALPMVICEGGDGGRYGDRMTFSGLLVYEVTILDGFAALGRVSHADTASIADVTCSNWWTASNSQVQRSIFMEDYVYSVAPDAIKVNHLDALGEDLAVVDLIDEP